MVHSSLFCMLWVIFFTAFTVVTFLEDAAQSKPPMENANLLPFITFGNAAPAFTNSTSLKLLSSSRMTTTSPTAATAGLGYLINFYPKSLIRHCSSGMFGRCGPGLWSRRATDICIWCFPVLEFVLRARRSWLVSAIFKPSHLLWRIVRELIIRMASYRSHYVRVIDPRDHIFWYHFRRCWDWVHILSQ